MDRKSVIVLVISFILLMIWYPLMNRLYPPQPIPQRTNSVPGTASPTAAGTDAPATVSGVSTSGVQAGALVKSDSPEELVVVENDNVRCTFTSHGGGLKLVELKNYPEPVACSVQMAMEWYDGSKVQSVSEPWFANRTLGCFPGTPRTEYLAGYTNVIWAAVYNRFFTMVAVPATNLPAPQVTARRINLPPHSADEIAATPKAITNQFGIQTAFLYPEMTLAPNQRVERRFDAF